MGEWIEHDGKGMPVAGETLVNVRYRSGFTLTAITSHLHAAGIPGYSDWVWNDTQDDELDIVAYRIVEDGE